MYSFGSSAHVYSAPRTERGLSSPDDIIGQMQVADELLERVSLRVLRYIFEVVSYTMLLWPPPQLRDTLIRMGSYRESGGGAGLSRAHAAALQGHHEVLMELETAARRHRSAAKHAIEAAALLGGRGGAATGGASGTSDTDALLRERSSLLGSHKAIDGALAQAAAAHEALLRQRSSLGVTAAGLGSIVMRVPGVQGLMDAIQRRKLRNDQVIAVLIGAVVCLALWYYVLRRR